jgi:hypothetical protein
VIYDLIVVGNGLAAQTFLFELFNSPLGDVKKSQNFSVAQIFSEEIAPACSVRTTSTVSLSGIEEGVSDLGNELHQGYFLFQDFFNKYHPNGIEPVAQILTFHDLNQKEKLEKRYKGLDEISSDLFKEKFEGKVLDSYVVDPDLFSQWFDEKISAEKNLTRVKNFVKSIEKNEQGIIECELQSKEKIFAKKVLLCTGAHARLYSHFFKETKDLEKTHIVPGAYLKRSIDLKSPSLFFTIDDHKLVYRASTKTLVIGSASKKTAIYTPEFLELKKILDLFNEKCTFSLGEMKDFKVVTGVRHKAAKRRPFMRALDAENSIFMINGFYKNGFTLAFLAAKSMMEKINL